MKSFIKFCVSFAVLFCVSFAPAGADTNGYRVVKSNGAVFSFDTYDVSGVLPTPSSNQPPIVAADFSDTGGALVMANKFGQSTRSGNAALTAFFTPRAPNSPPVVGTKLTPDYSGYWLVASDGGVFSYGDAQFYGSTGNIHLNKPIVGMASTPSGHGYWLVASDGGIFSYGDAAFYGSTGSIKLNKPVVGMAATPSGHGYWLVASDGGVFSYGDAQFYGSTGSINLAKPIVGIEPTSTGWGYRMLASDGGVFAYGDATFLGTPPLGDGYVAIVP